MIQEAVMADIAHELRIGSADIKTYMNEVLERVESIDPKIQAFVNEADRWERVSGAVTRLRNRYEPRSYRPALYGIPVGVKDIYHVDGLPTGANSSIPPAELAGPEAKTVTVLEDAGAFVLGKTVTTEFAYYDPGPTKNPHDPDHTPGGSSSGSAAAVAAGLCPLALGTQTYGSIARPASFCGVVGVKPSFGRVSTEGVIPLSPSADHVGFFTQDVSGARLAASRFYPDWRPVPSVSDPKIGVPSGAYLEQAEPETIEAFEHQVETLKEDYDVTRFTLFDEIMEINERHHQMVAADAAMVHEQWYRSYENDYGPELVALIEEGYDVSIREHAKARAGRESLRVVIESAMHEQDVDVLVSPSAPGPAPEGLDDTGDPVMNIPWTHSGLPTVTLPAGTVDGLPLGMQCAARFQFDEWLLRWTEDLLKTLEG